MGALNSVCSKPLTALVIVVIGVVHAERYLAMTGHAGVGKSYISTIMGCPQKSCPGGDSCTMETAMCKVNDMFIMDGVGTNHDRDMLVNYGGKEIKISGLSYPLFNFLETVEREKISTIEFFEVYTAANTRSGSASNYFYDFIKGVLECPTVRVLNMFEEGDELHEKNRVPSDLIVHRFQEKLSDLKGQPCKISLTPTWRDSLISGDFVGINSVVDIKVCENLKTEREKLKNRNNGVARNPDTRNCEETYQAGSFCEFYSHGFCIVRVPIHRKRQNPDCIRQRDEANAIINQQNRALHEENVKATERLAEVERELESCRDRLSNFQ